MMIDWQNEFYRYRRYFVDFRQIYRHKKNLAYTEIVLSILTTVFFIIFAIKPTIITITGLLKEIKDKTEVSAKFEEKIQALGMAQNNFQTFQNDFVLIDQALPVKPEITNLVKDVEGSVNQSQAAIKSFQVDQVALLQPTTVNGLKEINFSLMVNGDYPRCKNLLQTLVNLRRLISIDQIGISTNKEDVNQLDLSITAKAYQLD